MSVAMLTTSAFLESLFHQGLPDSSTIELRMHTETAPAVQRWSTSIGGVIDAARPFIKNAFSIWFGPGLRSGLSGFDRDVTHIPALWVDCDVKCFPGEYKEDAITHLARFSIPPSIIVDSGHGMQGYWSLSNYATGRDIDQAVSAMRWLRQELSRGLAKPLDSVHNPSRVMRLPNTWNRKDPSYPVICGVAVTSDLRYSLSDFGEYVPDVTLPELLHLEHSDIAPKELLKTAKAQGLPHWVADSLARPDLHDNGDVSSLDFAVVCELAKYMLLGDVERVWLAAMLGQRPKTQERPDYREQTLRQAASKIGDKAAFRSSFTSFYTPTKGASHDPIDDFQSAPTLISTFDDEDFESEPEPDGADPDLTAGSGPIDPPRYAWDGAALYLNTEGKKSQRILLANFRPTITKQIEVKKGEEESAMEFDVSMILPGVEPANQIRLRLTGSDLKSDRSLRERLSQILSSRYIVYPPYGWAHLWAAAQVLAHSNGREVEYSKAYAVTGWVEDDLYVLPGMDFGIGPDGYISCELDENTLSKQPERMRLYGTGVRLAETLRDTELASTALVNYLSINPLATTVLLTQVLAGPLSTLLREAPPLVHVLGQTGAFKTTLTTHALCLFGKFDRHQVPESWSSTQNALGRRLSEARDVTLLIDDYKKGMVRGGEPVALIQNYADGTSRSRMGADQENRASLPPRGLILSTGEDSWEEHESTQARTLTLHIRRPDDDLLPEYLRGLTAAQKTSMDLGIIGGEWVKWLAQKTLPAIRTVLATRREVWSTGIVRDYPGTHLRQVVTLSGLFAVGDILLEFIREQFPDAFETYKAATEVAWPSLTQSGAARAEDASLRAPFPWMISALQQALSQREICFTHKSKDGPPLGSSMADSVGYYDSEYIYLTRQSSFHWAEKRVRQSGGSLHFSWQAFCQGVRENLGPFNHHGQDVRTSFVLWAGDKGRGVRCVVLPREVLGQAVSDITPVFDDEDAEFLNLRV